MNLATLARRVRPLTALARKSVLLAMGSLRLIRSALVLATLPLVAAGPLALGADPPPTEPGGVHPRGMVCCMLLTVGLTLP